MSGLPRGWAPTTLGEIGEYLNGRGFRKHEWSETGRPIIRIQNLTGTSSRFNYYDGDAEESYIARRGDLLISWAATLGAYVWDGPEAVVNQHIFKVRSFIDTRFHRYLVGSVLDQLQRQAHGSGMVHVTRKVFDETPVGLPPRAEQRRIVAAIEEHLSRLDAASTSLERGARRSSSFADAVLASIDNGRRTRLADVTLDIRYGTSTKCSYDGSGAPVLRIPNIRDRRIDRRDLKRAVDPNADVGEVSPGDLLFIRTNGSRDLIGRVGVIGETAAGMGFASYLIRVRLDLNKADPAFVALALSIPRLRHEIEQRAASTAGQYNLNRAAISDLAIPLPPLAEQMQLVARIEEALSRVHVLADGVSSAQRRSTALRASILARAFRGELVPQDPDDEPASVLLERIAAERTADKPSRPRAATSRRAS